MDDLLAVPEEVVLLVADLDGGAAILIRQSLVWGSTPRLLFSYIVEPLEEEQHQKVT